MSMALKSFNNLPKCMKHSLLAIAAIFTVGNCCHMFCLFIELCVDKRNTCRFCFQVTSVSRQLILTRRMDYSGRKLWPSVGRNLVAFQIWPASIINMKMVSLSCHTDTLTYNLVYLNELFTHVGILLIS